MIDSPQPSCHKPLKSLNSFSVGLLADFARIMGRSLGTDHIKRNRRLLNRLVGLLESVKGGVNFKDQEIRSNTVSAFRAAIAALT
jgi:hypothetical protein